MGSFDIVAQRAAVGDIQRRYLYKFYLTGMAEAAISLQNTFGTDNLDLDYFNTKAFSTKRSTNVSQQKWAGQSFFVTTTDNSTKQGTMIFYDNIGKDDGKEFGSAAAPTTQQIYDFFDALQQLSGDRASHATQLAGLQTLTAVIAWVNPQKTEIVRAQTLENFRILGVDLSEPDKSADDLSMVTVDVCWDRAVKNPTMVGPIS